MFGFSGQTAVDESARFMVVRSILAVFDFKRLRRHSASAGR